MCCSTVDPRCPVARSLKSVLPSQGVASAGFPHYVLVPEAVDAQLGAESGGADEWQGEAAEEKAARLRLRRAAVDLFDPEELPAHLVRAALTPLLLILLALFNASARPALLDSSQDVWNATHI